MTPKVNPTPCNNPTNMVPKVLDETDSDPGLSYSSSSDSSDSSDDKYYKQRQHAKNNKKKLRIKVIFDEPIKKCINIIANLLISEYNSNVIKI